MTTSITIASTYYTNASLKLVKMSDPNATPVYCGWVKCAKKGKKDHSAFYYPTTGKFLVQEGNKRILLNESDFKVL